MDWRLNMQIKRQQILFTIVSILVISTGLAGLNSIIAADDANPTSTDQQIQPDALAPVASNWLYLEIEGEPVKGESKVTSLGRDGLITVYGLSGGEYVPVDVAGTATGKPVVEPIVFRKLINSNSPLFHQALMQSRIITKAEFYFYRPDASGSGAEELYYQITLTNAKVTSVRSYTITVDSGGTFLNLNEITLSISTITWTDPIGGITYQWSAVA